MKRKEPYVNWNEETGTATVILYDRDNVFIGAAQCHPDDMDMKSEYTGTHIAYLRAQLNYYKHLRDAEIKPAIKALEHIVGCYKEDKYDINSNEAFLVRRQIKHYYNDLEIVRECINLIKNELHNYLSDKEKFYTHIRKNRSSKAKSDK